ncbi:hypothetical protein TNCT_472131 [Trichonephila clavata]|uniref:Uncharacterized protein n=1 Tax=Trichonephila clavata TaxID=2740835 RepID=A0A8X6LMZ9_TRICU|nr:hypothetical protein TNCT_472131 [Trichonephila clavata]
MHSAAWQKRHNAVLKRVQNAVAFKGKVISVNQAVDKGLRPDLVAEVGGELFLIDITIPSRIGDQRSIKLDSGRWRSTARSSNFSKNVAGARFTLFRSLLAHWGLGTPSMMGSSRRLLQKAISAFSVSSASRTASVGPETFTFTI